jgi:outer membrane protein TolC
VLIFGLLSLMVVPAVAQPGQTPPAPSAGAGGSGSSSAAPADPNAGGPDWLLGVTEVNSMEPPPAGTMTLTLDKALDIAQKVQPAIKTAQAGIAVAQGHVDQARVTIEPIITIAGSLFWSSDRSESGAPATSGSAGTSGSVVNSGGSFFSIGLASNTGVSASASLRLTDFGLTKANINSAQYLVDAAVAGVGSAVLGVRLNVETAYLAAVADHRLTLVAESTVKSQEGHEDQARRFVAAQAEDPIQLTEAQANTANARSALAQARATELQALANLRAAIGWVELENDLAVNPNWPVPPSQEPPSLRELVVDARAHRPDLVEAVKTIDSADASLDAAHYERRPILTASATSAWYPTTDTSSEPEPAWAAGVTLSWSAWDGGKSRADVRVAEGSLQQALAARDALLVTIISQLDSARSQIISNKVNVSASTEAVTSARASLQLAEARYKNGLGSQIELADAQTAVTTAEGSLVTAEWQLATAWAQLRFALGRI